MVVSGVAAPHMFMSHMPLTHVSVRHRDRPDADAHAYAARAGYIIKIKGAARGSAPTVVAHGQKISRSVRPSFQASDHAAYGPPSRECHRNKCTSEPLPWEPHRDAERLRLRWSRTPRIEFARS